MNRIKTKMKPTGFNVVDEDGNKYRWTFYRDRVARPSYWWFVDHEGYERYAGKTWDEAAAKIQETVRNYGCTSNIS